MKCIQESKPPQVKSDAHSQGDRAVPGKTPGEVASGRVGTPGGRQARPLKVGWRRLALRDSSRDDSGLMGSKPSPQWAFFSEIWIKNDTRRLDWMAGETVRLRAHLPLSFPTMHPAGGSTCTYHWAQKVPEQPSCGVSCNNQVNKGQHLRSSAEGTRGLRIRWRPGLRARGPRRMLTQMAFSTCRCRKSSRSCSRPEQVHISFLLHLHKSLSFKFPAIAHQPVRGKEMAWTESAGSPFVGPSASPLLRLQNFTHGTWPRS